jgi:predicted dehydrogenase
MQKIIVLGAGHWHLPLYRDAFLKHHEIVGVWDIDPDAAARAAADLDTTTHDSVDAAIAAHPDLAYVLGVHAQMPDGTSPARRSSRPERCCSTPQAPPPRTTAC